MPVAAIRRPKLLEYFLELGRSLAHHLVELLPMHLFAHSHLFVAGILVFLWLHLGGAVHALVHAGIHFLIAARAAFGIAFIAGPVGVFDAENEFAGIVAEDFRRLQRIVVLRKLDPIRQQFL